MPGLTAGTCLRKDFAFSEERSNAPGMLLAVSRVNEARAAVPGRGGQAAARDARDRKVAVLGLTFKRNTDDERDSLSHKLIRLLERELADVAVCDPHAPTPTQPLADAVQDADVVIVATNHSEFERPEVLRADPCAGAADDCLLVDPWNALGHGAGVRLRRRGRGAAGRPGRRLAAPPDRDEPRARHRAAPGRSAPRSCGGCSRDRRWEVRVADHRAAPSGCARGARSTPATCATVDVARAARRRLHARDPPGGDRRRDRQLPQAPVHADRGQQRAHRRRRPRRGRRRTWSASSTCPRRWCSSGRPSSRPPRTTWPTARRPARRTASPSSPARSTCRAAHDQHGLRYTICRPFNAYGPGELPDADEPGIAHAVPDLIAKVALRPAPAPDLRLRRADADAHARRRHRRRDRHRDGVARPARTRTSTSPPREELTVPRSPR